MRWTPEAANRWYDSQPFLSGCNFIPSNAVNQLEMFQAETFDPATNDREMAFAAALGFNTLRIFLHALLHVQPGFLDRLETILSLAALHNLRVMPVLFDSCWDPRPQPGPQPDPIPGVHNSRWVQSPGAELLMDPAHESLLQAYVHATITRFKDDPRILAWDLWNEPDNGWGAYSATEPEGKLTRIETLLPKAFSWVREAAPSQPATSALWAGDFTQPSPIQQIQLDQSDILSFHNYEQAHSFAARIASLRPHNRPILCTEYMARNQGSTFAEILPVALRERVAAIHWGLVTGRTQTRFPWDSWQHPYTDRDPELWCHDILLHDVLLSSGTPYLPEEAALLRQLLR